MGSPTAYERVLDVISAAPEDRDEKDIDLLLPWFKRKAKLFSSLASDVTRDILKNCEFRRYVTDDVIIRQGDKGHCFFVVLNGSISIYIAADEDEPASVANGDATAPRDVREELGTCVRNLGPGTSFGELALIDAGSIRKASVVADEASDFIVVDRKLYSRSLKVAQKRDLDEKREFIESHPLFKTWKARHKSILAMSLSRKRALFGHRLVQQGSKVTGLLFILRGQAVVTISPWKHPNRQILERQRRMALRSAGDVTEPKPSEASPRAKGAPNDGAVDVCSIGPGDMIGDLELACDVTEHVQTVTCLESMEAFEVDMSSFHRLVTKRNPLTLDRMRIAARVRLRGRTIRSQNESLVSLLDILLRKLSLSDPETASSDVMRSDLWMTQRRPIIDGLGPGSLHHRAARMEEKLRRRREKRRHQTGALAHESTTVSDGKDRGARNERPSDCKSTISSSTVILPPSINIHGQETVVAQGQNPGVVRWADKRHEKLDTQRSSTMPVTSPERPRECSRENEPQTRHLSLPSFLQQPAGFHGVVPRSARCSGSSGRDARGRAGLSSAPACYRVTVREDGVREFQLLRRQYSADEYKSLKDKLRFQEKRHMRYMCSLW